MVALNILVKLVFQSTSGTLNRTQSKKEIAGLESIYERGIATLALVWSGQDGKQHGTAIARTAKGLRRQSIWKDRQVCMFLFSLPLSCSSFRTPRGILLATLACQWLRTASLCNGSLGCNDTGKLILPRNAKHQTGRSCRSSQERLGKACQAQAMLQELLFATVRT